MSDVMKAYDLTKARVDGLSVLHQRRHDTAQCARESNRTSAEAGTVYWQTSNWLIDENLAYIVTRAGGIRLALTDAGLTLCEELFG